MISKILDSKTTRKKKIKESGEIPYPNIWRQHYELLRRKKI
jgi:hypothetical protein